ncbi:oligosaccharide flippase family protein [Corynebacterium marinum]|uniref:Uncharacterized protein n=1 Tax=Corynebacterium marinum DSM 44953 TaxID=1224162 RepID=A0A0B6TV03_9CORY|nr:oligosaccharide flippase family protein [Corynebacterium marinum]AJK69390.1 hypothetical protein B840_08985 [Corynebacterium marinum DSM 44953]GGO21876.1 flippase [Corynebacterium marinum]
MLKFSKSFAARESLGAISWNFVGMAFSLFTGVITARILAPDDRGLLALFLIISSLSYLLAAVGTNTAIRTFQPRESWASFCSYFQLSAVLLAVNVLISISIVFIFSLVSASNLGQYWWIISLLAFFTFISSQLLDVLNAVGMVSYSAFANISGHFSTMSVLVFFFIGTADAGLANVAFAYIFGFMARIVVILTLIRKAAISPGRGSSYGRRSLLKKGVGFWGVGLGQTLTFRADQLLLGLLSTPSQVGLYAVASTPASLMQVVSNSIGQVAFRQAAVGKLTVRGLARFLGASSLVTFFYVSVLWILAPWVVPFVFGPDYAESANIVRILLISELFLGPYLVLVRVLAGLNQPRWSSASGFVGLGVMIPSLVYLVPLYGAYGAAISTIMGFGGMFVFTAVGALIAFRGQNLSETL